MYFIMRLPVEIDETGSLFDNDDRGTWLEVLGNVCGRFNWVVHAYYQLSNPYLLVETVDGSFFRGRR